MSTSGLSATSQSALDREIPCSCANRATPQAINSTPLPR